MRSLSLIVLLLVSVGCRKPYHEATLVPIGTSEVAILVETINDAGQAIIAPNDNNDETAENRTSQGEAVDFYARNVVNARMVEIPYFWKQTHRVGWFGIGWDHAGNGEWRPAARLIVVDTQVETREWSTSESHGTSNSDQGIWVESKDSVGFSTGISVTANIENADDAVVFLSNYPPQSTRTVQAAGGAPFEVEVTSLTQIMDMEVRTKVQEVFAYEAANYNMDELREKKREILDALRDTIVPYFEEKGITISTIGQFGGFTYENPAIQESIDAVFQAQQDEEVAVAEARAAEQRKEALRLMGEGQAEQAVEISRGNAEALLLEAEAEAQAVQLLLEQLGQASAPYIALKQLEVELERIQSWDGQYPNFLMEGGEEGVMGPVILELPSVE